MLCECKSTDFFGRGQTENGLFADNVRKSFEYIIYNNGYKEYTNI